MGNLRDQLKKAKLIDSKRAKQLAHEERVHRAKVGGAQGVEREQKSRAAELAATKAEQSLRDADREASLQNERATQTERKACEELLAREMRAANQRGGRSWYFQLADGRLPRLEVGPTERAQLQEGVLCVMHRGSAQSHDYGLLLSDHARRVEALLKGRVAWAASGALSECPE